MVYAKVYLTVPGELDRQYMGLYTAVEDVGSTFLSGTSIRPRECCSSPRACGFPYLGEDFSAYKDRFAPKDDVSPKQGERLVVLARLVNQGG